MKTFLSFVSSLVLGATPLVGGCASAAEDTVSASDALAQAGLRSEYQGWIGDLSIMARFEGTTDTLRGSYFYVGRVTKGEEIKLTGTREGSHVVLEETVLGTKTGSFEGTVDENGHLEGTWKKADGSGELAFQMFGVFAGEPFTVDRKIADSAPALETSGAQENCSLDASYIEVFGLADQAVTRQVNDALRVAPIEKDKEGRCAYAESSYTEQSVKFFAKNVLVVETMGSWFGGGAHPINGMEWKNISLTTGAVYGSADVFKPEAKAALEALLLQGIAARADLDQDLGSLLVDQATFAFEQKDVLSTLDYFATADGIRISLFNWLPHAAQALDVTGTLLPWRDVNPLLAAGTEIGALSPAPR